MNKKIIDFFDDKCRKYLKTLCDISLDTDNKENLVELKNKAYNYDKIIKNELNPSSNRIDYMTPDALLINNEKVILIEFKNSKTKFKNKKKNKLLKYNVRLKALEGVIALGKLLNKKNITENFNEIFDIDFNYILVYSSKKNKDLVNIQKNISISRNTAHRNRIDSYKTIFHLNRYQDLIFNKINTISDKPFQENYDEFIKC